MKQRFPQHYQISGNTIHNANILANMLRSKCYVCPVCGNVIHSMTKEHYISFVAAASSDDMQMRTLYPEGNAEVEKKKVHDRNRRDVRSIYAL